MRIIEVDGPGPVFATDATSGNSVFVIQWHDAHVRAARICTPDDDGRISLPLSDSPAPVPKPAVDADTVAVVICTRDRPDHLKSCLSSLKRQSRRPDQIVVVDNASRTGDARQVCLDAGVDYVREDRPGLDIARNTGARLARADIIAYTDDDVVLHPTWLERLAGAFESEAIEAVTGLVLPLKLDTHAQRIFEFCWSFGRGFSPIEFTPEDFEAAQATGFAAWEIGAGANMAFRKRVFDRIGWFDESLDVGAAGCSGDSEFWYRIVGAGGICRYDPAAVVFHHHRDSLEGLRQQLRAYMRGHVAALRVQAQRFPGQGNLRRISVSLPAYYARRLLTRLRHGRQDRSYFLLDEIIGALQGVIYPLGPRREQIS